MPMRSVRKSEVPFLFILMHGPCSCSFNARELQDMKNPLRQYCNGGSLAEQIWHDGNSQTPKEQMPTDQAILFPWVGARSLEVLLGHAAQIWHFLLDILLGLQHLHRQGWSQSLPSHPPKTLHPKPQTPTHMFQELEAGHPTPGPETHQHPPLLPRHQARRGLALLFCGCVVPVPGAGMARAFQGRF